MSERFCACNCGQPLEGLRANARYASDACRSRDWKRRAGYVDPRAAKPRRNVSRQARRPTAPRVSYRKAITAVADWLADYQAHDDRDPLDVARSILDPLLPPAARKALSS